MSLLRFFTTHFNISDVWGSVSVLCVVLIYNVQLKSIWIIYIMERKKKILGLWYFWKTAQQELFYRNIAALYWTLRAQSIATFLFITCHMSLECPKPATSVSLYVCLGHLFTSIVFSYCFYAFVGFCSWDFCLIFDIQVVL